MMQIFMLVYCVRAVRVVRFSGVCMRRAQIFQVSLRRPVAARDITVSFLGVYIKPNPKPKPKPAKM